MSNRFHSKYHRQNHHTYTSATNPDAGHDPIASPEQPFRGDFVLAGSLSCVAPTSATAGYFSTNNTALCAIAGYRGLYVKSGPIGGEFLSTDATAVSAFGKFIGGDFYSNIRGLRANGTLYGIDTNSPNIGIYSNGTNVGGAFYSNNLAISASSPINAIYATSPQTAIRAQSTNYALSANGSNIAITTYSPLTGAYLYGDTHGANISGPSRALLTSGTGVNILNNRTGIFKSPNASYVGYPSTNIVLDVNGDLFISGNATIVGNLSTYNTLTQLDTHVRITSSLQVNNAGTDAAATFIQTGNQPILVCYDREVTNQGITQPSFIVDGSSNGWVGIGVVNPTAPFNIVKNTSQYQGNNQPQVRISDDNTTNNFIITTPTSDYDRVSIGTETPTSFDIVTNAAPRLTFTAGGNIGINTVTPNEKFEVKNGNVLVGNGNATVNINQGSGDSAIIDFNNSVGTNGLRVEYGVEGSTNNAQIWNSDNGYLRFATNNAEKITILANGNVGINQPTPTQQLHVNGVGYASSLFSSPSGYFGNQRITNALTVGNGLTVSAGGVTITGAISSSSTLTTNGAITAPNATYSSGTSILNAASNDTRYGVISAISTASNSAVTPANNATFIDTGLSLYLAAGTYQVTLVALLSTSSTLGIQHQMTFGGTAGTSAFIETYSRVDTASSPFKIRYVALPYTNNGVSTSIASATYSYETAGTIVVSAAGILKTRVSNSSNGTQSINIIGGSSLVARKIA